jgi:hypothetical protein
MVDPTNDLEGNIKLDSFDNLEEKKVTSTTGFRAPEARPLSQSSNGSAMEETLNTLDEPVSETIVST